MDLLARELDMDPAELRRKNYIPTDRFPNFTIASGLTVDSGDYPLTHDTMIDALDYDDFRRQQAERRQSGSTQADRGRLLHLDRDVRPRALARPARAQVRRRRLGRGDDRDAAHRHGPRC